jgi:hypothetical protein
VSTAYLAGRACRYGGDPTMNCVDSAASFAGERKGVGGGTPGLFIVEFSWGIG